MSDLAILGDCPKFGNVPTATQFFQICLAQAGEGGPRGYVVKNRTSDVCEYVARSFVEAYTVMNTLEDGLARLVAEFDKPELRIVQ